MSDDEFAHEVDIEKMYARAVYLAASRPAPHEGGHITPLHLREAFWLPPLPVCDVWEDSVRGDIGGPCRRPAPHEGGHDPFWRGAPPPLPTADEVLGILRCDCGCNP